MTIDDRAGGRRGGTGVHAGPIPARHRREHGRLYRVQVDLAAAAGATLGLPNLTLGAAGVDIFLVISGFIMVHASERQFGVPGG